MIVRHCLTFVGNNLAGIFHPFLSIVSSNSVPFLSSEQNSTTDGPSLSGSLGSGGNKDANESALDPMPCRNTAVAPSPGRSRKRMPHTSP